MHTVQFIKKYKHVFNVYALELHCRLRRNTIAHAIGNEKRQLPLAYEDQVQKFFEEMEQDLSNVTVEYWQKHKKAVVIKELSSSHGVDSKRKHAGKRKTK
jgi:hypothetical protein